MTPMDLEAGKDLEALRFPLNFSPDPLSVLVAEGRVTLCNPA
jgi:hypothetical protein